MVLFPPDWSLKLQPLDRTFKRNDATSMDTWMRPNPGQCLTIYNSPSVVREAWPKASISTNIVKGFEVSGIGPLNQEIFHDDDFAPAFLTDRPKVDTNHSASDEFKPQTNAPVHILRLYPVHFQLKPLQSQREPIHGIQLVCSLMTWGSSYGVYAETVIV